MHISRMLLVCCAIVTTGLAHAHADHAKLTDPLKNNRDLPPGKVWTTTAEDNAFREFLVGFVKAMPAHCENLGLTRRADAIADAAHEGENCVIPNELLSRLVDSVLIYHHDESDNVFSTRLVIDKKYCINSWVSVVEYLSEIDPGTDGDVRYRLHGITSVEYPKFGATIYVKEAR